MQPRKSILDRSFVYTSSAKTDLRKKFAAIRRQLREAEHDMRSRHSGVVQPLRKVGR